MCTLKFIDDHLLLVITYNYCQSSFYNNIKNIKCLLAININLNIEHIISHNFQMTFNKTEAHELIKFQQ